MATPTTVEEYLRQIPNPSPCPHSPTPNDPPCRDCVENRIKVANALRAGQDPSAMLGLGKTNGETTVPPVTMTSEQAAAEPVHVTLPAEGTLDEKLDVAEAQIAAAQMPPPEPVELGVTSDDGFDDEGFPIPGWVASVDPANEIAAVVVGNVVDGIIETMIDNAAVDAALAAPELPFTPGVQQTMSDEQWLPGMTHTEPVALQAQPASPAAATLAQEMLAKLTGGGEATSAPPGVEPDPLALTPEQLERRAAIEADTHPAVRPIVPSHLPRGEALGTTQQEYASGDKIVMPDGQGSGTGYALPVGEALPLGAIVMLDPETGLVVIYDPAALANPSIPDADMADVAGEPGPEIEGDGSGEALPPIPEPSFTTEIGGKTYQTIQQNSVGQSYGWTGTEWELIEQPPEGTAIVENDMGEQVTEPSPMATAPATEPVAAPEAAPDPTDTIAQAAAVAAPVQVDPSELTAHCEHGMPATDFSTTPPRSASCGDCLMHSDGPPPHLTKLRASRFQIAHLTTHCARAICHRDIHPGEVIGHVEGVGWCCAVCTKPERTAPAPA